MTVRGQAAEAGSSRRGGLRDAGAVAGSRQAFVAVWAVAIACYGVAVVWVFAHPPAISSDDALYFTHALTRFSTLDFSPQFPGYPGFVALGRLALLVAGDPLHALALSTAVIALALPPVAAAVVWRVTRQGWSALAALALTLANPLMPDLALNLLSDGAGILFLLVFLALLPERTNRPWRDGLVAGLALGFAAACRPSDAALFAGALAGMAVVRPRLALPVATSALVVGLVAIAFILAHDGLLYFTDGLAFVEGHARGWGNTVFADGGRRGGWFSTVSALPGGVLLAAVLLASVMATAMGRRHSPVVASAFGAFVAHAAFVAVLQNPDHLRHLAPLAVLGSLLAAMLPQGAANLRALAVLAVLVSEMAVLLPGTSPGLDRKPPVVAIVQALAAAPPGSAVATREDVFALRSLLPSIRVYDLQYPADAALGLATAAGKTFRVMTTPPASGPARLFPGRFPGEEALWLKPVQSIRHFP